jgi:hypothetical protein
MGSKIDVLPPLAEQQQQAATGAAAASDPQIVGTDPSNHHTANANAAPWSTTGWRSNWCSNRCRINRRAEREMILFSNPFGPCLFQLAQYPPW